MRAITVIAETTILAKTYQPNNVLNQCGSIDIIQSQDIIDSVTIKNAKKPADNLGREILNKTFERIENLQGSNVDYNKVKGVAEKILLGFADNQFDQVSIIYNQFVNAITQNVVVAPLIPANVVGEQENERLVVYDYEPEQNELLELLLPRNITTQVFSALLESSAAELAARMTAMDNATRNAGDMIDSLTLVYNRTRQANITKELIEIISGAEAL